MPKSSSFTVAVGRDEDVRRLEVAVHDEVRCACCTARRRRAKRRSRARREAVLVAVAVDRLAVDVLHDEVRLAVVGHAAVEQPRDVRMIERREDLSLGAEAVASMSASEPAAQQLERDLLLELSVGALGEEDAPMPAAAELADDAIGADDPPARSEPESSSRHERRRARGRRPARKRWASPAERAALRLRLSDARGRLRTPRRAARSSSEGSLSSARSRSCSIRRQRSASPTRREVESVIGPPPASRSRKSRALTQSRSMVRGVTPSSSATSRAGEPGEEAELDDLTRRWSTALSRSSVRRGRRSVELDRELALGVAQRDAGELAAALGGAPPAREVDEHLAHRPRRRTEEVAAPFPSRAGPPSLRKVS